MKKRQMILAVMLAGVLTGCGQKDGSNQTLQETGIGVELGNDTQEDSSIRTEDSMKTEDGILPEDDTQD